MDTGASCNVISSSVLKKTNFDFKNIKKTEVSLRQYDGSKLNVIGKALLRCERNGKVSKMLFYVVKGNF